MQHLSGNTSAQAHFAQVPTITHSRNGFSVAKRHLTTCQFDYLYPMYVKYIYPGDTLNIFHEISARLTTQKYVLYDDLYIDLHAWFVPMRLIQTNWARYQFNAQPGGPAQDNSALTSPKITLTGLGAGGFVAKTFYDYLGLPTGVDLSANLEHINNYAARAYHLVWNENYRDENLQNPVTVDLDDGPDDPADYATLLKRGRRHDKFSSCLTAAQKGTAVSLPLGTSAAVKTGANTIVTGAQTAMVMRGVSAGALPGATNMLVTEATTGNVAGYTGAGSISFGGVYPANLYADLSTATAATLNQVRQSYAVQHLLEADARGGTRDVESIQHRWGVTVPDFRLQRPEYLGGSTTGFDGHLVPQTSETGTTPQANLTMFSQTMAGLPIAHSFVEHGVFMILFSARSNITYQQGLKREFSYRTRYDWYQPEFANLGEVAVLGKEIYCSSNNTNNNSTFGFQEYAYELRYDDNMVTGEMRSNYSASLDVKHLADDYSSLPTLGSAWIVSSTDIERNLVVSTSVADPIEINQKTTGMIARTLPMFSIPGLKRL